MGRWSKRMKKYERHLLLGLVILLLVSFSVTGALQQCQEKKEQDWSGSLLVSPTKRATISNNEFVESWQRYEPFVISVRSPAPSIVTPVVQQAGITPLKGVPAVWMHLAAFRAAEEAGYSCGDDQLRVAIAQAVQPGMGGLGISDATYDRFLMDRYRGGAEKFQDALREVVIKEQFLRPLTEPYRYPTTMAEAYEDWKLDGERVNLGFVALESRHFALQARSREQTRTTIDEQLKLLDAVTKTARTLYRTRGQITTWRRGKEDAWPESLAVLPGAGARGAPKDDWDRELRYVAGDEVTSLASAGPDGEFDTADDVTLETLDQIRTLAALREVGRALEGWREHTSSWPPDLDVLRKPLPAGEGSSPSEQPTAALLRRVVKDGWDRLLVYEPGEAEGTPRLFSMGPDGEAGTEDDAAAEFVEEESVLVPPSAAFAPFLLDPADDAWERSMRVAFADPATWRWQVVSAGPDGEFATDDDVKTGNEAELRRFYRRADVSTDFREPTRRAFEAVYVHLPLLPDDVLQRMWEAFPEHHPKELDAFDAWRQGTPVPFFGAEDPADPETGHGAELAKRLASEGPVRLVPDAKIFGDLPEDFVTDDNPDRKTYVEKGWRPILLRQQFVERVLNDFLARARDSHAAVKKWEEAKKAFDETGEGEDPGEEPPAEITFESLLAREMKDFMPGDGHPPYLGYIRTEEPLSLPEWEADEHLGDPNLSSNISALDAAGQYMGVPINLHDRLTKVMYRNLEYLPQHQKDLDDVREEVFERYLETKRLAIAQEKLEELRAAVEKAQAEATVPADGEEPPADEKDAWEQTLKEWGDALGATYVVDETGFFVGSRPPEGRDDYDDLPPDEAATAKRRDYVRTYGYGTVRPVTRSDDGTVPGTLGREVRQDTLKGGTESAYLTRVLDRRFPPPEALSPEEYRRYVFRKAYGVSAEEQGAYLEALQRFFGDLKWMKDKVGLDTAADLERFIKPQE